MAGITASQVKELRDATNVSMMDCKRALVEADGNKDEAIKLLRKRGMAVAAKKATRATNSGLVDSATSDDGNTASLVEINCETDFVARNPGFQKFVADLAKAACLTDAPLAEEKKDELIAKVAEIGENLVIRRNERFVRENPGKVDSYIHLGGKVGVLVELGCEKDETAEQPVFSELARDLSLHVAAAAPQFLTSDEIPEDVIAGEREIYADQVKGKPDNIIENIINGKLKKFFAESCMINQGFVKEPKQSITELLEEKGKELDDKLTVRRFSRYQLGE